MSRKHSHRIGDKYKEIVCGKYKDHYAGQGRNILHIETFIIIISLLQTPELRGMYNKYLFVVVFRQINKK